MFLVNVPASTSVKKGNRQKALLKSMMCSRQLQNEFVQCLLCGNYSKCWKRDGEKCTFSTVYARLNHISVDLVERL